VDWLRTALPTAGADVRVLSVDFTGTSADVTVPYRASALTEVPVVVPAPAVLRCLHTEAAAADLILLQSMIHPLSLLTAAVARATHTRVLTVVHGAQPFPHGAHLAGLVARAYDALVPAAVLRLAPPVTLSLSSNGFLRDTYGVEAVATVPFPLAGLPAVGRGPRKPGPLRVVCASRLSPEKDLASVVQACDAGGDLRLDVYGDGPGERALRELEANRPWLRVHGAVPWREVIAAQAAADVCISAARMENVGVAILEALALGTPAVTTAVGDAPRYLPEGLGWMATAPGRPEDLATALQRVRNELDDVRRAVRRHAPVLRARHAPERTAAGLIGLITR
jgi:glycosyltransferase involved in cell wall biosynthesis